MEQPINSNTGTGIEVDAGAGPLTINAPLVLQNNQQWIDNSANALTANGAISGSGSLTKLGSGMLTLTGVNNYSGNTTVDGGTLQISSGLLASPGQYVGYSSTGSLTQSGGTHSVSNLTIGVVTGSSGTCTLSGGSLFCGYQEYIGYFSGSGSFTQSGGTNSVSGDQNPGIAVGKSGTYNLSGSGLLSATSPEQISGAFQQTGGTNTAGYVSLNGGRYLLSAGMLEINGGLQTASGTLNGGGGSAVIVAGSSSLVDLSGSVVNTASTSLTLGPNSLVIVPPGFNPATAFQTYSNPGLTHTLGTTLTVSAGTGFGGWGTVADAVFCQGTITATIGGAINLANGLTLSGTGQVALGQGTITVNDLASGMGGQSLAAGFLVVGSPGTGSFTQSAGTNSLSSLYIGNNASSSGTYNLTGGGLNLGNYEIIGESGTGRFMQSGGTNSVFGAVLLGNNSGGSGMYNLSGSGLLSVFV